jgi:hypothetical protein
MISHLDVTCSISASVNSIAIIFTTERAIHDESKKKKIEKDSIR